MDAAPARGPVAARVTYVGHATVVLEAAGGSLVTDPVLGDRIAGYFTKRRQPTRFRPEEVPDLAGILISHAHHDHLDYDSLRRFGHHVPIVVPWGVAIPLRLRGYRDVRVLRPGGSVDLGGWTVIAVAARHFGGRLPFVFTSGYQGYVVSGPIRAYFAGDTGFDEPMFRDIGKRFDLDLALLPIAGALRPAYRRNHMNADEALRAYQILGARQMLPIHFETFPASFDDAGEARRSLDAGIGTLGADHGVTLLNPGERVDVVAGTRPDAKRPPPTRGWAATDGQRLRGGVEP